MSVISRWTGPDPAAIGPAFARVQADVEASVMARLQRGAEAAYRGTRFAGTFVVRETTLFSTDPIFTYVEAPTRPHAIDARNAAYLYFQVGGRWVRTKHVTHPGTAGKRLLEALFDAFGADIAAQLGRGWEQLRVQ